MVVIRELTSGECVRLREKTQKTKYDEEYEKLEAFFKMPGAGFQPEISIKESDLKLF